MYLLEKWSIQPDQTIQSYRKVDLESQTFHVLASDEWVFE